MTKKNGGEKHRKREQSKLSRILSQCNSLARRSANRIVTASNNEKSKIAIRLLFKELSPNEIKHNFTAISGNILFRNFIWLARARKISETFSPFFSSNTIEQDLIWCALIIQKHKLIINESILKEKEILKSILEKDRPNTLEKINELESLVGFSIWIESLKSGINLTSDSNTCEQDILQTKLEDGFLKYIINRSCGYYQDEDIFLTTIKTDKRIFDRDKENEAAKIASYYSMPQGSIDIIDYKTIFKAVRNTSIYDIYKLLISYLKTSLLNKKTEDEIPKIIIEVLQLISTDTEDPLLNNLCIKSKIKSFENCTNNFDDMELYELYINEKYEALVKKINSMDIKNLNFEIFELAVRANIRSKNLTLTAHLMDIAECMEDLILKNAKYAESYQSLCFIAYTFRALDWFNHLQIFIEKESEFISKSHFEFLEKNYSLYVRNHSHQKIALFGNEYTNFLKDNSTSSSANLILRILSKKDTKKVNLNTSPLSLTLIKIRELIHQGRPREVLENLYIIINQNKDPVLTIEAKRLLIDCLLLLNKNNEAISIFVTESLNHLYNASIYDIEGILSECIKEFKKSSSIDYPIALSIFSRLKSSKYDSELKYSFEIFLHKNGYEKPQNLLGKTDKFEKIRLFYFLKWVCTQENMSLFMGFSSPEEIEECRTTICDYLIRKGDTSDYLIKELQEINKRKIEVIASKNIDKNRIFVDTSSFYGRDSEQYRILFDRYLQYCKIDFSTSEDEVYITNFISTLKTKDEINNYDLASLLSKMHIPDIRLNKKNATFLSIAKLFREEFTYGSKGLNNHLSTRIRHGVLPTTLRKPFSDGGLYISSDNSELDDMFQLAFTEKNLLDKYDDELFRILKIFSLKIESHIKKINDCWLQIYTQDSSVSLINNLEEENIGKFNFSISAIESYFVQQSLPISPTYDDLVKVMVNWLWGKTNHNISTIRDLLKSESEPYLNQSLEDLKLEILDKIPCQQLHSEISNAISRTKGKVLNQLELIQSWFDKGDHLNHFEPTDLSTIIEIAGKSLSLKINTNTETECKVSSRSISYFVDIFHILFENAVSKSGLDRGSLKINARISSGENESISICVNNKCSDEAIKKIDIDFYQEAYGDEDLIRDSLQKEGGTGFFKIWKILEKDLDIKHKMNLSIGENIFYVTFSIPRTKDITFQ